MRFAMRRFGPRDLDTELIVAVVGMVLLAGVVVLRVVPERYQPSAPCTFHSITGYPCLTCGGTRAARCLGRLELGGAISRNPLVAVLLIAALPHALWVLASRAWGLPRPRLVPECPRDRWVLRGGLLLVVFANWVYLAAAGI